MKAEHRHELKKNELAEFLGNLPQWLNKNKLTIIYVTAITLIVAGLYIYKKYQSNVVTARKEVEITRLINQIYQTRPQLLQAQAQGVDASFVLIKPAEQLKDSSQDTSNDSMAAMALIKQAEALRIELHYRTGNVAQRDFTAQIVQAKDSYALAAEKGSGNPPIQALAKLGTGLCEEELGNFDTAKNIYAEIVQNPEYQATTAAAQAALRLDTIDDYRNKIVFAKAPLPIRPEIKLIEKQPEPNTAIESLNPQDIPLKNDVNQ